MARSLDLTAAMTGLLAASATALWLRRQVVPVKTGGSPAGRAKSTKLAALETGAAALQPMTPLRAFDVTWWDFIR